MLYRLQTDEINVQALQLHKLAKSKNNRPFQRYGGHFGFINLKHITGFPGGKHAKCFRDGYVTSVHSAPYAVNSYSSLNIMGDQPDENTKEFSKEELNVWNVEKLRKYLKDRGIVITGDTRKRNLISN